MKKGGASEGAGPPLDFHNAAAHPSPGLQRWAASFVLYGVGSAGGHFSKCVRSGAPHILFQSTFNDKPALRFPSVMWPTRQLDVTSPK